MNFYKLKTAFEPEIIGVKNGIDQVEWLKDKTDQVTREIIGKFFTSYDWNIINKKPEFTFTLHVKMLKGAMLTDFVQLTPYFFGCPFLISKRVKEVFEKFNIQTYYLFPAIIYDKDKPLENEYYLFYQPLQDYDIIDFEKSIFYTQRGIFEENKIKRFFKNLEEYKNFQEGTLHPEKLAFNSNFDSTLDLFKARLGGMYVSEALKDAIEILGFTGVHVLEDYEPEIIIQK